MDSSVWKAGGLRAASSAGLGLASAKALAAEGCRVVVSGRDPDRLAAAVEQVPGAIAVRADVATPEGATAFVRDAADALGGIDVLVPNVGGPPKGGFGSTPLAAYQPALELNLLSTVAMCIEAVPAMRERGWGRVVAITSQSVRQPLQGLILSNTARAGVTGFLKTLAIEVAPDGVTVNSVLPGSHRTDRLLALHGDAIDRVADHIPVRRLGDADDFGAVVVFVCSEHARFITGAAIPVDGGTTGSLL